MADPRFDVSEQGSAGWLIARQGCLTASKMADAVATTKDGRPTAKYKDLLIHLVAERITESSVHHHVNAAMKHGSFWESTARETYEIETGNLVKQCGFALHGEIEYFGASPDGLVGADGLIEIKCPTIATYTKWLAGADLFGDEPAPMPTQYIPQMLVQLAVTGRKWCDFVGFFPGEDDVAEIMDPSDAEFYGKITVPDSMRIKVWRFEPTADQIAEIEAQAVDFLGKVDRLFDKIILEETESK